MLFTVCLSILVLPASLTGTSVALPAIGRSLGGSVQQLQWVVNAYNLTFACFMLAAGSVADVIGRRRTFLSGSALFIVASAASAIAPTTLILVLLRGIAGIGAAMVMTAGAALLAATFTGASAGRAFALLGSAAGAGLAFGPSLAGVIIGPFGWRGVFLLHALLAVVAWLGVPALRESKNPQAARVDYPGAALFAIAMALLTAGIVQIPAWGLTASGTVALFASALVLFLAFGFLEHRSRTPMLDLRLLRQPAFVGVCLVPVALTLTFVSLLIQTPTLLTSTHHMAPAQVGAFMLALTIPVLVIPLLVARVLGSGRISARGVMTLSLAVAGIGAIGLGFAGATTHLLPLGIALAIVGIGMGVSAGTVDGQAIAVVGPEQAGTAAGLFNTMRLASEALGIALVGAVVLNQTTTTLTSVQPSNDAGIPARNGEHVATQIVAGNTDLVRTLSAAEWHTASTAYANAFERTFLISGVVTLLAAALVYGLTATLARTRPNLISTDNNEANEPPSPRAATDDIS